ncbi:hypothetical protein ROZALSC1DRAFT_30952 [Rozella allomycis CSF55]|uniref:Pre-mRNA-splicing factor SLU7 n=1 Tax=Rozella allomycis (strain CSF55) TaxID=988480 RepID=A0A075ASM3_ROZAC|nr:Pre-mRNA splicing Prp18-interacting factor domain-containing protein [Rozella allomycis CSF55]RKP17218.1 hypothetical protein ROZALSC1DRAFT_30952 [Rozella allomycis CSF55]|eukprot:EPZ31711.1 Pre-mRNA splicing Prp18-interacting factor domain-containing protein [Rozella allomycis CSF55]
MASASRNKIKKPDVPNEDVGVYVPMFIAKAPWYTGKEDVPLELKLQEDPCKVTELADKEEKWYARGAFKQTATKYRKGACENCGAMTHKTKECFERPRKKGAKYTNQDIAADEIVVSEKELNRNSYEAKRDRWMGYDVKQHVKLVEEHEKIEAERIKLKAMEMEQKLSKKMTEKEVEKAIEEDEKYVAEADMPGQRVDLDSRMTVRNLRLREDTAKYLLNLDPNSAFYNPKTRSMKDNPLREKKNVHPGITFAGEDFVRYTGEAPKMNELEKFAWDQVQKGADLNFQAVPSKAETEYKKHKEDEEKQKEEFKKKLVQMYGGEEHLKPIPEEYLPQNEIVEVPKEKNNLENTNKVFDNNHTSIFGSYEEDGKLGYACCHSLVRNSYCTGREGIAAAELVKQTIKTQSKSQGVKTLLELHQERMKKETPMFKDKREMLDNEKALDEERIKKIKSNKRDDIEIDFYALKNNPEAKEISRVKGHLSEDPMKRNK